MPFIPLVIVMTSWYGNIFHVTGPLCGEFTGHRWIPRRKASDAELWCFLSSAPLNKRLSKQSWGWWFETPSRSLWRHYNDWIGIFRANTVNTMAAASPDHQQSRHRLPRELQLHQQSHFLEMIWQTTMLSRSQFKVSKTRVNISLCQLMSFHDLFVPW